MLNNNCNNDVHVHEAQATTEVAEVNGEPHTHRIASMTEVEIPVGNGEHIHRIFFRTDTFNGHFHEFLGVTEQNVEVGDRHVHFVQGTTSVNAGHSHEFRFATLIEDPISEEIE